MNIPVVSYMGLTVIYVTISVLFVNHVLIKNLNLSDNFKSKFFRVPYFFLFFFHYGDTMFV